MANRFAAAVNALMGRPPPAGSPFVERGVPGTAIFGGFVEVIERSAKLGPGQRWITAGDLLANISIIAAGLRFFLNLTAKPAWKIEPARDNGPEEEPSDAAKKAAEFFESVLDDLGTSFSRIVRRSGMYRYHGFGIQEWTAKRRADGMIGILDIEPRPGHTIERWQVGPSGDIEGVWQRSPQDGQEIWLPRQKLLYLVDDTFTDSPEGMGLFRHLVEPGERMTAYLKLEGIGFQRDLRGIPVGRAPIDDINQAVTAGTLTAEQGETLLNGLRKFVRMQTKSEDTGLIIDSKTYVGTTGDGTTVSGTPQWAIELLSSQSSGLGELGKAIERLRFDMALLMGTEQLVLGGQESGNRALSEDKSQNTYLNIEATLDDIVEAIEKDIRDPVWKLNGLPDELKPTCKTESVAPKDLNKIAQMLRDMATAGVVLRPDDPAIDDLRDLAGISRQPDHDPELLEATLRGQAGLIPDPEAAAAAEAAAKERALPVPKKEKDA